MPTPPAQGKAFQLSKANPYENTSVRDKIKKWQTEGGGVLQQIDAVADSDKESKAGSGSGSGGSSAGKSRTTSSHAKSKSEGQNIIEVVLDPEQSEVEEPKTPSQLSKQKEPVTGPPKPKIIERKPKANVLDDDVRDAIAPKKRIVSDGHWKRKHIDPNAKPPSPPKVTPKKKEQYGWVRPPVLPRPGHDKDETPPSPPKKTAEPQPMKVYTGKGKTKPIATQIHSQLSMRPKDSVPIPIPTPPTPKTPATPRVRPRRLSTTQAKKIERSYKSEEESPPKTARSNPGPIRTSGTASRSFDAAYMSNDEKPRKRISKSRKTESDGYRSEVPTRKRSLSVGAPLRSERLQSEPRPRRRSVQKSPDHYESAGEERQRRRRTSRRVSDESKSSYEDFSPPSPPRELNNYDDEAEKRRSDFRAEFKTFKPPKERRSRKRGPQRFSYSPEGIDRIPQPPRDEAVPEPIAPQRQTSHRIEAWLGDTPDPFKETKRSSPRRDFSFEEIKKPSRHRQPESTIGTESTFTETTITDSTITDLTESTIAPRKYGHDRTASSDRRSPRDRKDRAKSEPSENLDPDIEVEYSSTTSVPTLKRSGARHGTSSPTARPKQKSAPSVSSYTESYTESDITSTVVSSSIDPRDFNKPGEGHQPYSVARRLFPSTGKRLSTIVSVETLATKAQDATQAVPAGAEGTSNSAEGMAVVVQELPPGGDTLAPLPNLSDGSVVSAARSRTNLKRKLTTHKDLMTVLSMPTGNSRSGSVISARSIRTHRSRLETATLEDLMAELVKDETKYMRELRTLADGVIPILLKSVLSKSSAADAAGLFTTAKHLTEKEQIAEASKVIHNLSVAIQRLKSLHTRIPKENHFSLLIWAQSAQTVYEKYIKTWRLGFQDVVVSLAQPEGAASEVSGMTQKTVSENAWDQMPRNEDGYIVDAEGERVDVAFLLKRPLVRLKYLTKTIKGINIKKPSEQAGVLAKKFEGLMEKARNKVDDEKARLEDEAAASIDASRARDPKSLAPLAGVKIDATRCVRARDFFDLHLPHSTGQTVDCRVELLVRDDAPGRGKSGDILICEVDESDRWLLFPPVEFKRISSRASDEAGQLIVMLRGMGSGGEEWDELFTLTTEDEEVRFEWVQWLGLLPVPPPLDRKRSFSHVKRPTSSHASSSLLSASARTESTAPLPLKSRTPSPREIEIPIGERAGTSSKRWSKDIPSPKLNGSETSSFVSSVDSKMAALGEKKDKHARTSSFVSSSYLGSDTRTDMTPPYRLEDHRPSSGGSRRTTPRNLNEAMALAGGDGGSPTLKRTKATRYHSSPTKKSVDLDSKLDEKLVTTSAQHEPAKRKSVKKERSLKKTNHAGGFSVWIPNSEPDDPDSDLSDEDRPLSSYLSERPPLHHRTSSVPTLKLPSVPKQRSSRREDEYMSGALIPEPLRTPSKRPSPMPEPLSAPSKLERRQDRAQSAPVTPIQEEKPPPPPPHRTPSTNKVNFAPTPQFTPTSNVKRRSSSPLKHEYRPSSPSSESSYTEDEDSLSEYSQDSLTSESEDDLEDDDIASTFVSSVVAPAQQKEPEKPADLYSLPNGTIKPSESASQAPYRTVPQAIAVESKPSKCLATIFTWSDKGQWELLHPTDCSIVITPGLIAAYNMGPNHQSDELPDERPLVAQELTPLVPLRRGTALDITIRSPPTPASRLRPGSNIMFRSRSSEECEMLYNLINRSRINNPTYIALQNARPPTADGWAAAMERQNSQRDRSSGGWFSGIARSKSYRASSRAHSTAGNTESSIGTISSVITAMKRFSGSGNLIGRLSRDGSDSLGSGGSGTRSPPQFVADQTLLGGGAGITNAKVRLYVLQSKAKWADLGSAKLSILPKDENAVIAAPIMLHTGLEKRVVVAKKNKKFENMQEKLLDVTLPEPCFERWARTGIGVSVWIDAKGEGGGIADTGGVGEKRVVKYMIQLKSERECAYIFSLLGKLRY